jgi:hypothetical protein
LTEPLLIVDGGPAVPNTEASSLTNCGPLTELTEDSLILNILQVMGKECAFENDPNNEISLVVVGGGNTDASGTAIRVFGYSGIIISIVHTPIPYQCRYL